jgi:hypothetical protein
MRSNPPAGLDPRDVGVADTRRGEVALGQSARKPEALDPGADAFPPRHTGDPLKKSRIQWSQRVR